MCVCVFLIRRTVLSLKSACQDHGEQLTLPFLPTSLPEISESYFLVPCIVMSLPLIQGYEGGSHKTLPSPCFVFLCFNASCQFTPFLNLHCFIFGLTPFGWLCSIILTPYFWWKYHFLFTLTFSGMQLGCKTRAGCIKGGSWLNNWSKTYINV
jgi:hypothetical protein